MELEEWPLGKLFPIQVYPMLSGITVDDMSVGMTGRCIVGRHRRTGTAVILYSQEMKCPFETLRSSQI